MGLGVASRSLHGLLVIALQLLAVFTESRQTHDHSSTMSSLFIHMKDLKKGTTKPIYLPKKDYSNTHFLPRDQADLIPFSSSHLREILTLFAGSPVASSIEDTITTCERPPVQGETKFCATSLESMLDFVLKVFGIDNNNNNSDPPTLLTTKFLSEHREVFQNYTALEAPEEVPAEEMVGCHTLGYPYTVAYCHTQEGRNEVYKVSLRGENGDLVDAYVACHLDTWQWDPKGPSFAALGTRPGDPVCHLFPPHGNFLWVHNDVEAA